MERFSRLLALASVIGVASAQTVPIFGQCGGQEYSGPTACAAGSICVVQNPFFSQCVAGTSVGSPTSVSSVTGSATSTVAASPTATPTGFVKTSGTHFTLNGKTFSVVGANSYWVGLMEYDTTDMNQAFADILIPLQRYSDRWRRNRRLFQQNFRQSASSRFYPAQYMKIHQFLRRMTAVPEEFMQHTMSLSQGLIYTSLYGIDFGSEDPLSRKAVEFVELVGEAMLHPYPIIERFPWLRFIPSWFPGFGFQKRAKKCAQCIKEVDSIPFDKAVNNLKMGTSTSLIAELALESEGKPAEIEMIKAMGTISFLAGADTTMSSISSFLLTMTQHPDIQSKARAEIDRIIGRDRLPTFEDRSSLPYVESIYREVMRMHPPVPLGLFHVSTEDDFYRGYHIPKGCTVVANIWAMNRDPNTYPEPDKFIPERFLDSPSGPFMHINSVNAFGFGRRVCAGRHMAENTVWLTIVSVLATLDLRKAHDSEGNEFDIPGGFTRQFFRLFQSHPMPYRSSITPRDLQAQELLLATDLVYSEFKY